MPSVPRHHLLLRQHHVWPITRMFRPSVGRKTLGYPQLMDPSPSCACRTVTLSFKEHILRRQMNALHHYAPFVSHRSPRSSTDPMHTICYTPLLATLFVTSCAGPGQTTGIDDITAPKNANVITVHSGLDSQAAYRHVAQVLQNRGYTFRSTDEMLLTISTEFSAAAKRWGVDHTYVRVGASVTQDSPSVITIRGWFRTIDETEDDVGQRVKKFGQNGSPSRNAWNELHDVASAIGDSLSYAAQ